MRRSAVLVLLLACAAAVGFLLLQRGGSERTSSRRHDAKTNGSGAVDDETAPEGATVGGTAGSGGTSASRDDDPNRVPGPDLVLTGRVVREGAGVRGATVTAIRAHPTVAVANSWILRSLETAPPPIATTTSGDGGHFQLTVPRRSRLTVRAAKRGGGNASLFLLMPATGNPPELTLELQPGSTIAGIVVGEKEKPVKDVDITLTGQDWTRVPDLSARTDEEGKFALEDVPEGSFRIRAQAAGYPEVRRWVYVPSQTFVKIDLRARGIITGKVVDGAGTPLAGARVLISTGALDAVMASGVASGETDEGGVYRLEILPGAVDNAIVEHPRCGRHVAGADSFDLPTGLVAPGAELKYDVKLRPGVPVRGHVVYADTQAPVAGATVALLRMSSQWRGMSESDVASADAEGKFEFPYVTEGTYALEAKAERGARLPVRYPQGNQPVTIDFFVDGESSPPEQRVELLGTGGVHGRMLGIGEPVQGQRPGVFIMHASGYSSGTVDDLGTFELTHVPVMEDAVVQSNNPPAKSDPFRIEAGKVAEVTLDAGTGGVPGIVVDDAGNPVAGARVYLSPQNQLQAQIQQTVQRGGWGGTSTGSDGRFTVPTSQWNNQYWRNQKFVAIAMRREYTMAIGDPFDLPDEGGPSPDLRLVLRAGGVVRGRVVYAGGAPAVNVSVSVSPKQDPNSQVETRSSQSAYTGYDGRFEVKGVGEGVYLAGAYDGIGKTEPQDVRAGDEDVNLVIEPALAIAGVVVSKGGGPVASAQVSVLLPTANGEQPMMGQTQANGRFRLGQLSAGSYAVEVSPGQQYGGAAGRFEKKRVDGVAAGTEDLVIVVEEGKGLRGKVEDRAGHPIAGAGVIAMSLEVPAPPQGPGGRPAQTMQAQSQPSAITNGRGEFELKGVGEKEVEVLAIVSGYLPSTERAVAGGPDVTLRLDTGEVIEGRLLHADGTPVVRQWVSVQATTKEVQEKLQDWQQRGGQAWNNVGGWSMVSSSTDAEGRFRFASLLPGEYRFYSQQGTDEILPATIVRTGMPSVTLRFERALSIKGRVVGPGGRPIVLQQGRVSIGVLRDQQWLSGGVVSEDGTFELRGLPAGMVTVQVWGGKEYKPAKVDVASGTVGVVITLEPMPVPPGK